MPLEVPLVFPQTLLLLYDGLAIKQILSCFVFILPPKEKNHLDAAGIEPRMLAWRGTVSSPLGQSLKT